MAFSVQPHQCVDCRLVDGIGERVGVEETAVDRGNGDEPGAIDVAQQRREMLQQQLGDVEIVGADRRVVGLPGGAFIISGAVDDAA